MKPTAILIVGLLLCVGIEPLLGEGTLSPERARVYLKSGALLVDVRTVEEFSEKNLPDAVNIPLDTLESGIGQYASDKSQVVLLHCRSGRRSGIAERELRELGYTNAFNIGGYDEAKKIVLPPTSRE
jgi:phage shock protein E